MYKTPFGKSGHIYSIFNNTVRYTSFIHYLSKLNFLCTFVPTTINYPQNLGIQLHKRCNKDLPKLQSRYNITNNENKNKNPQSTIPVVQSTVYTLLYNDVHYLTIFHNILHYVAINVKTSAILILQALVLQGGNNTEKILPNSTVERSN